MLVRLTKETLKRLMKLTKKATKEENRLKIRQLEHIRSKRCHETNTKKRGRWSAVGLEKNGLRSFHGCNTRKNSLNFVVSIMDSGKYVSFTFGK